MIGKIDNGQLVAIAQQQSISNDQRIEAKDNQVDFINKEAVKAEEEVSIQPIESSEPSKGRLDDLNGEQFIKANMLIMNANSYGYSAEVMGTDGRDRMPVNNQYNYSSDIMDVDSNEDDDDSMNERLEASPLNTLNYNDEMINTDTTDATPYSDTYEEEEDAMYDDYADTQMSTQDVVNMGRYGKQLETLEPSFSLEL